MRITGLSLIVVTTLLVGCATGGLNPNDRGDRSLAGKIQSCRTGDTPVDSSSACLADDAACYQIASGGWCTGVRADKCPSGSSELAKGAPCPPGARCFNHSESKVCVINFN